ncbi:MAG: permease-like cell division protein FtsX [Lachnospiraceae bacterium]
MNISTFGYILKEGLRSLVRNRWYTMASIATISACLFLLGAFCAIVMNVQYIVQNVQKGVSITVFFDEGFTEEDIFVIQDYMETQDGVESVTYISADEAWVGFVQDMQMEEYLDGYPDNPLENCANLEIFLNDVTLQADLVSLLETTDGVRRVNRSELAATTLAGMDSLASYASLAIIGILLAISIFLITNTVTIGIAIRQEEINIMKYIGATDFFVRCPFIIEGVLIGFLGAVIPLGVIYFIYQEVLFMVTDRFASLSNLLAFLSVQEIYEFYLPLALGIGVGIGFLGSYITCHKHLRV